MALLTFPYRGLSIRTKSSANALILVARSSGQRHFYPVIASPLKETGDERGKKSMGKAPLLILPVVYPSLAADPLGIIRTY